MKRVFLMTALIGIVFSSCKKDETNYDQKTSHTIDYMQLKIGNYWVYERYNVDLQGNEIVSGSTDSLVITGDTLIREILYYKKVDTRQNHTSYLRDSSGYLVDHLGNIMFSDHNFTDVLRQDTIGPGLAVIDYKMMVGDTMISIPMGDYQCLDFRGMVTPLQPAYPHGTQYTYYFWADGLGMIRSDAYYYSNPALRTGQKLKAFGTIGIAD